MNRDYVGYVLAVVSIVIGGYVSWYYYDKSLQFKRPIFNGDFLPQAIYDAKKEVRVPLKVTREDGSALTKSVYSANHIFWNAGNLPIAAADVLVPIRISISDPGTEVLSASVAMQSRKVVDCKVTPDGASAFILTFRILEQDDGCMLNVFYSGTQSAKYTVSGEIVGVKKMEARTETAWEILERDQKNQSVLRSVPEFAIRAIPWIAAVVFAAFFLRACGRSRARTIRTLTGFCIAITLYLIAIQIQRQQQILNSPPSVSTQSWSAPSAP